MKSSVTHPTKVSVSLVIAADTSELEAAKVSTLRRLSKNVSVPGFRKGRVPLELVEKQLDRNQFLSDYLDDTMSRLYEAAVREHKLRPVSAPKVEMKKFVPFSQLEFIVEAEIIPNPKIADYKNIKVAKPKPQIEDSDVEEVIKQLQTRHATKNDVTRSAKNGDQVWIDFRGIDSKDKPVPGADGKDYPLILGSKTFIPGFEDHLVGKKAQDEVSFTITFPKDYQATTLQNKKVTFHVTVNKVQEVVEPKPNSDFAKLVGPFETITQLKKDIRKQLESEQEVQATRDLQNQVLETIISKSDIEVPTSVIQSFEEELLTDFKNNLQYRGMSLEDYLKERNISEAEYRSIELAPLALKRAKAAILLSDVAESEAVQVSDSEIDVRLNLMKQQYPSANVAVDDHQLRRSVHSELINEKTIAKLLEYATK